MLPFGFFGKGGGGSEWLNLKRFLKIKLEFSPQKKLVIQFENGMTIVGITLDAIWLNCPSFCEQKD